MVVIRRPETDVEKCTSDLKFKVNFKISTQVACETANYEVAISRLIFIIFVYHFAYSIMDLYTHSPIRLKGEVLNLLSTKTTLASYSIIRS
jgi:hypothetical protein